MSKNIKKYLHREMDNKAGFDHSLKRTKIVATIGPSCDNYEAMVELVKSGANVFRLNFSHGTHEDKGRIIDIVKKINDTLPYTIAIIADLQGPKLRVGEIENNAMQVVPGEKLVFTNNKCIGTKERIYVSYPDLH
ncbi:MAG TPA: pyruvate kinase, partial [Ginsengibacter sp.]|nr:pyruvate kinase [Ginsengibacter sp.]